jgi:FxsC-like protein
MRYFFLSHAHTHDGDGLVRDVFEDLSWRVREVAGADRHEAVGHVARCDRLTGPGGEAIGRELARAKLLVPLYSPRYFASPECGRVVSAIIRRDNVTGSGVVPIAPLLWIPPVRSWPPVPALPIEVPDVERYDGDGLLDVMLSRGAPDADRCYDAVLDTLARFIVERAASVTLPVDRTIDPASCPNAFTRAATAPRVSVHVLAPDLSRLPVGRERGQYGATSLHWTPYLGEAPEGLGSRVETMARHLGYQPTLAAADDIEEDVCGRDPPSGPAILLLDPWALEHAKWRDQLEAFDRQERPWVTVMAAWNLNDPQTGRTQQHLLHQLNATLERRFRRRRPGLHLDADVAASLQDVGRALPTVLQESTRRYLRWMSRSPDP